MAAIREHDKVRVFDVNGSRSGQPEGGWIGTVVKVGRTLAHIDYEGARETQTFRLNDGRRNDDYAHRYFLTLAEAAERDRIGAADETLRAHGVELSYRRTFTLEQREALADVVRTWGQEG